MIRRRILACAIGAWVAAAPVVCSLLPASAAPKGSLVEDRAARKLLDAGDARLEADEADKAIEIWRSVIERYPRSRHRFDANIRLGDYLLNIERKFDEARPYYEAAASTENEDAEQRSQATLQLGISFFEGRHYGKAFKVLRELIEEFPAADQVDEAYHYIGLGHFKLGHYSRAIVALEKVGTALSTKNSGAGLIEAGRRLFLKIEDLDIAILDADDFLDVQCASGGGDVETVRCIPLGKNGRFVLGSIPTSLGVPKKQNGILEVLGGDIITARYDDSQTEAGRVSVKRLDEVTVVGSGVPEIMDGSFSAPTEGVVVGRSANIQITDADRDRSAGADSVEATLSVVRRIPDQETNDPSPPPSSSGDSEEPRAEELTPTGIPAGYAVVDFLEIGLEEVLTTYGESGDPVHTGVFRHRVPIARASQPIAGDAVLQALPGDKIQFSYVDQYNISGDPVTLTTVASCIEGDLGDVRVTRTEISSRELHLKTRLRTASALTQIGNHYKDFGLAERANQKFLEALEASSKIELEARLIGGAVLEETYVQLWRTYFAMEELQLALAMSRRLLAEFPNSAYVDEAMIQQAHVSRRNGEFAEAVNLYSTVVKLRQSSLRGEAQFQIAECYEQMALLEPSGQAQAMFDRAFAEYQKVYEQFPDSGRIGEAVSKMASFFYQKQDYARAIDVFETVLDDHPDAAFLDVIIFNYGRCLYRLERKKEARERFDQLIGDYPESPLASEAKQISEALTKAGF